MSAVVENVSPVADTSKISYQALNRAPQALATMAVLAAGIGVLAYIFMAISFARTPFIGVLLSRDLTVYDYQSFTSEEWIGFERGIIPGDKIIGVVEGSNEIALEEYSDLATVLSNYDLNDTIVLRVQRDGVRGIPQADSCPPDDDPTTTICNLSLPLERFPTVDFVAYFGIGLVAGLIAFGLSVFVLVRRFSLTSARFLASVGAAQTVVIVGVFNLLATHVGSLEYLWVFAASMMGGTLISFAMVFPNKMAIIEHMPSARFGPVIIAVIFSLILFRVYQAGEDGALLAVLLWIGIMAVLMSSILAWRRQYTSSPVFREQTAYAILGATFGILPLTIWTLAMLFTSGNVPEWTIPFVQVILLLFIVSTAYAILEEHLLETASLVPTIGVYSILSALLIIAYVAVVTGLSAIGVRSLEPNNPILIAVVVLVIALGFTPVRNYLNNQLEDIWFRRRRNTQRLFENLTEALVNASGIVSVERIVRSTINEALAPTEIVMFVRDNEAQVFRAQNNSFTSRPITDVVFPVKSGLTEYLRIESSILYLEEGMMLPPMIMQSRSQLAVLNAHVVVRMMGQRQELNGFIVLGGKRSGENYTYEELQFLERVADQAALTLERTQIVEDLERRFEIQDVLSSISRSLSYAIDLDIMLELLYAQTTRVIDCDIFAIALVDQNQMYFAFYSEGEERIESRERRRWLRANDLLSEIAETQNVIRTDNYLTTARQRNPNARIDFPQAKAMMAAPLTADTVEGTLGVMVIASTDPTLHYTDEQLQIFLDIAGIAASAIDKIRLFEATKSRSEQLETLNKIASELSTQISNVDQLLQQITQSALEILKCEAGSLLLVDEEDDDIVFRVALGPGAQGLVGRRIGRNEPSLVNEAIRTRQPIITNDTASDERWHGEIVQDDETLDTFNSRAILTTPLMVQGNAIGALQIINKRDGSPFTNEDATLLTTFATQAAVAIQNAKLYALQDERLIERVNELEGLAMVDQALNKNLQLQHVASITLQWAIERSGAKAGALLLINTESETMTLLASQGYGSDSLFSIERVGGEPISIQKGIWSRVIRTATPAFARNLDTDPDYIETLKGAVVQIVIPIRSAGNTIGVLLVESDNETDLTLVDMDALTRFAEHASPALANSILFQQLRNKEQERSDFVRFVAHELGNPTTSVKGYTDLLMKGVVGPLNEQQTRFLELVYNNIRRVENLINDLRDVERMDTPEFKLDMGQVDFAQIVREVYHTLQAAFERKNQTVELDLPEDLPLVWGDKDRLIQVLTNFMTNANKYTPAGGQIFVRAEEAVNIWDKEGVRRVVHVSVRDTGIGISEEDLKKLFREKYFRTDNAKETQEPGTGLGMILTRGLIEKHGGTVWVESVLNEGSTFHFTIPLADEIIRQAI
ncbi:MAG: hypothetical protein CUN55_05280 [Phototrophicales bacterium]|nr:MAG: hypothetical protein CUN55_05280 [Phototrophicales bacterium]